MVPEKAPVVKAKPASTNLFSMLSVNDDADNNNNDDEDEEEEAKDDEEAAEEEAAEATSVPAAAAAGDSSELQPVAKLVEAFGAFEENDARLSRNNGTVVEYLNTKVCLLGVGQFRYVVLTTAGGLQDTVELERCLREDVSKGGEVMTLAFCVVALRKMFDSGDAEARVLLGLFEALFSVCEPAIITPTVLHAAYVCGVFFVLLCRLHAWHVLPCPASLGDVYIIPC
jgi:hypothetical protein